MSKALFIGLMSGTSLDGVDAVLTEFNDLAAEPSCQVLHTHTLPYSAALRAQLLALHHAGDDELAQSALLANALAKLYAQCVLELLAQAAIPADQVSAIGCHGQTIRHRPELGFTLQIGNAALLTELTGITVVSDFRSRDIAAGGQGAPLVPAFHRAVFAHASINRVILNIGGIANLSYLPVNGQVTGFDSGPGNMLMDAWAERHIQQRFDQSGQWAAGGIVITPLLQALMTEPYLQLAPPKSTGRDLFSLPWLQNHLRDGYSPQDVQRTLLQYTVQTISDAVLRHCPATQEIYLCGGGAHNNALYECLQHALHPVKIYSTDMLGIGVNWVEAAAFAWLAKQALQHAPGNLPAVTGAKGPRILGAVYAY